MVFLFFVVARSKCHAPAMPVIENIDPMMNESWLAGSHDLGNRVLDVAGGVFPDKGFIPAADGLDQFQGFPEEDPMIDLPGDGEPES